MDIFTFIITMGPDMWIEEHLVPFGQCTAFAKKLEEEYNCYYAGTTVEWLYICPIDPTKGWDMDDSGPIPGWD